MLETLKEMISSLPINDVTSEELFVNLEKIRAKYKQVGTRLLETLNEMISSLPINDVTSEELFVNLEKIRAKYKQVGTRWSYTDELMCLEILIMNEDHFFFHHSSKILVIW